MRSALPLIVAAWIFAATPLGAQIPTPPVLADLPAGRDVKSPPPDPGFPVNPGMQAPAPVQDTYRFWLRAEYLAYWVKNTPLPVSLVTGDPNNPTQELLNSDRSLGVFSGFRIGFGFSLNPNSNRSYEVDAFSLQRRSRNFFASSDNSGSPLLSFPFANQTPGAVGDSLMPITSPGQFAGNVSVTSTLQLWGAEANGAFLLVPRQAGFEFTALAGFRYLDLHERLNISTLSSALNTNPNTVLFQSDQFNTGNQFYGGQLGGRINWQGDRFGFDLTGKVALGVTHQVVDIQGFSAQTGPGGVNGVFPGGFFTQPSNIGRHTANRFTVVPSIETKFYLFITSQLRAFVGYDFMYWNQVVRPGSQIDRNINLSQSIVFGNGVPTSPANPAPLLNRTDFWAQGLTLGLEFRF